MHEVRVNLKNKLFDVSSYSRSLKSMIELGFIVNEIRIRVDGA